MDKSNEYVDAKGNPLNEGDRIKFTEIHQKLKKSRRDAEGVIVGFETIETGCRLGFLGNKIKKENYVNYNPSNPDLDEEQKTMVLRAKPERVEKIMD